MIIFEGRNGSSNVVSHLNSNPEIICYPEIMARCGGPRQKKLLRAMAEGEDPTGLIPFKGMQKFFHEPYEDKIQSPRITSIGFKTKLHDICILPEFFPFLVRQNFALVYLFRKNRLKAVISHINALRLNQKTSELNATQPEHVVEKLHVSVSQIQALLERRDFVESLHRWFYDKFTGPKTRICYEEMLQDEARFFSSLQTFLGVEPVATTGKFFKNTSDNLQEAVANYDELRQFCIANGYERFLED